MVTKTSKLIFSLLLVTLLATTSIMTYVVAVMAAELRDPKPLIMYKEFTRDDVHLKVYVYRSYKDLTLAIQPYLADDDHDYREGFSVWSNDKSVCSIYVVDPLLETDFEAWGHELAHCVYGKWHKE